MKHAIPFRLAAALATLVLSGAALAAGDHAGGHGPGHGEAAAIGKPGDAKRVTRTVEVDMSDDMRFKPAAIRVKTGETIRFRVKNAGKLKHEMVIGTEAELKEHYQAMLKAPEMEHDELNSVTLDGGKFGELVWQFTKSGTVPFACLQPGHYDAGMKGSIAVK